MIDKLSVTICNFRFLMLISSFNTDYIPMVHVLLLWRKLLMISLRAVFPTFQNILSNLYSSAKIVHIHYLLIMSSKWRRIWLHLNWDNCPLMQNIMPWSKSRGYALIGFLICVKPKTGFMDPETTKHVKKSWNKQRMRSNHYITKINAYVRFKIPRLTSDHRLQLQLECLKLGSPLR